MLSTILDIYSRAHANQPLTAAERALLRLIDGLGVSVVVAIVMAAYPLVTLHQYPNLISLLTALIPVILTAAGLAILKYFRAHAEYIKGIDPTVGALLSASEVGDSQAGN